MVQGLGFRVSRFGFRAYGSRGDVDDNNSPPWCCFFRSAPDPSNPEAPREGEPPGVRGASFRFFARLLAGEAVPVDSLVWG